MSQNSLDKIYDQFNATLDMLTIAEARHDFWMSSVARQTVDNLKQQIDEAENQLAARYAA